MDPDDAKSAQRMRGQQQLGLCRLIAMVKFRESPNRGDLYCPERLRSWLKDKLGGTRATGTHNDMIEIP